MTEREVLCVRPGEPEPWSERRDEVAVEEPLEIRVAGDTLAITMRTPGEDRELALGFLLTEGVIASLADVSRIAHCGRIGEEGYGNTIEIAPGPGTALAPESALFARRGTLTSAACGVCGRSRIDDLLAHCAPLPESPRVPLAVLVEGVARLSQHQPNFARTGGLHAAAALDDRGQVLAASEDIGRHNAVDKVIGALMLRGCLPASGESRAPRPAVLVVSGRVSFEVVQKAVVARIPVVCGVSAPTSLAIDLARRSRLALAAFARGGKLNLYAHADRIER